MSESNTTFFNMKPVGKPCQCYLCSMSRKVVADAESGDVERMRQSLLDLLGRYHDDTEDLSMRLAYAEGLGGTSIDSDQKPKGGER